MKSLQSLRGIFAFFIFLHHLWVFDSGGDSGVCFFIMLSGFVMSAGYGRKIDSGSISYRSYMERRIRRIYPYHIIGFLLAILIVRPFYGWQTPAVWLANLAMLQSWVPEEMYFFSCDFPSWCLSDLFFCYALFPFLILRVHGIRRLHPRHGISVAVLLTIGVYLIIAILIPQSLLVPLLYVNPLFRIVDFILGMLLWQLFSAAGKSGLPDRLSGLPAGVLTCIELTAVAVLVVSYIFAPEIDERFTLASWWWLPAGVLIFVFASVEKGKGLLTRVLHLPWLVRFGELSFAFYMLHWIFIQGYRMIPQSAGLMPADSWAGGTFLFLITLLLSFPTDRLADAMNRHFRKDR